MNNKTTKSQIRKWQGNSPEAFRAFLADMQPQILHRNGQYRPIIPTETQNKTIDNVLASKKKANLPTP
jgi:hypothetical protein